MSYPLGKLRENELKEIILGMLGAEDDSVVLGPRAGVDFGVIRVGGKDLIVEVDPVYVVPEYGWERSAWYTVQILANDVAVSGVPPRYMFMDLNLPPSMSDDDLRALWKGIHEECMRLGVAIAAGHTGRYEGASFPHIGGGMMVGVADPDRWVSSAMARPGDSIVMTKGAAVEAAGILAATFPDFLRKELGDDAQKRASDIFWKQSVVRDALALSRLGLRSGVSAMHDAGEYGVIGGLYEMATASGVKIVVEPESIFVMDEVRLVLDAFSRLAGVSADPLYAITAGTLLAAVSADVTDEALRTLRREGIEAAVIGRAEAGSGVYFLKGGTEVAAERPERDPFWELFSRASRALRP